MQTVLPVFGNLLFQRRSNIRFFCEDVEAEAYPNLAHVRPSESCSAFRRTEKSKYTESLISPE